MGGRRYTCEVAKQIGGNIFSSNLDGTLTFMDPKLEWTAQFVLVAHMEGKTLAAVYFIWCLVYFTLQLQK